MDKLFTFVDIVSEATKQPYYTFVLQNRYS